jgi:hypothetical protein
MKPTFLYVLNKLSMCKMTTTQETTLPCTTGQNTPCPKWAADLNSFKFIYLLEAGLLQVVKHTLERHPTTSEDAGMCQGQMPVTDATGGKWSSYAQELVVVEEKELPLR